MGNDKNRIGRNITELRRFYKKSQEVMAENLGTTKSSISNYENGTRRPEPEMMQRIAKYFKITVTELENRDYLELRKIDLFELFDEKLIRECTIKCFPIFSNEDSLKNKNFKMAYELHKEVKYALLDGNDYDDNKENQFLKLYKEAYKEGVIESIANIVSWKLFIFTSVMGYSPNLEDEIDVMDEGKKISLSNKQIIDFGFLNTREKYLTKKEEKEDVFEKKIAEEQNNRNREYEYFLSMIKRDEKKEFIYNIAVLKRTAKYADLADYYIALGYMCGLYDNEYTFEENKFIGIELFDFLNKIGNKYVRRLTKIYLNESTRSVDDNKK